MAEARGSAVTSGRDASSVGRLPPKQRSHAAACILTVAACLGTYGAMLETVSVALARVGAHPAGLGAGLDDAPRKRRLELGLASQHATSRRTLIGAVVANADAGDDHPHVVLTEASIRARRTALRTIEARFDTSKEYAGVDCDRPWMGVEHLPSVGYQQYSFTRPDFRFWAPTRCKSTPPVREYAAQLPSGALAES
jgi:hypothetical protein